MHLIDTDGLLMMWLYVCMRNAIFFFFHDLYIFLFSECLIATASRNLSTCAMHNYCNCRLNLHTQLTTHMMNGSLALYYYDHIAYKKNSLYTSSLKAAVANEK